MSEPFSLEKLRLIVVARAGLEREITSYLAEQRHGPEAWRAAWLAAIDRIVAEPFELGLRKRTMRPLLITTEVKAEIAVAIVNARRAPVPIDVVKAMATPDKTTITLADRPPGFSPASQHVDIPIGYRAAISFEEQPAGLVRHLSVSVDTPGNYPNVPAVQMIAHEFGIEWSPDSDDVRVWLEEFDPGHFAVNLVGLIDADQPTEKMQ
jgi:hypothetical protein